MLLRRSSRSSQLSTHVLGMYAEAPMHRYMGSTTATKPHLTKVVSSAVNGQRTATQIAVVQQHSQHSLVLVADYWNAVLRRQLLSSCDHHLFLN